MKSRIPRPAMQEFQSDKDIATWTLPKGATFRLGRGVVMDVAFSPNGTSFSVGTRLGVWWYEFPSMTPIALWDTERGVVSAVAFSPCGKRLAASNWDGLVKVWDISHRVCITQMERHGRSGDKISKIVFSPDGKHLAASSDQETTVYLWHPETGKETARLSCNTTWPNSRAARPLTFSPDSHLLACASPDDTHQAADLISVWNVNTGERVASLRGHKTLVYALDFSPCGQYLASGDRSGTLRVWDVTDAKPVRVSNEYAEKHPVIPSYSPSGTLLAAGVGENTITVWNVESCEKLDTFEYHGNISVMHFSSGTHLAVATPFKFKVWTAGNSNTLSSIPGHTHIPFSLTFSPDGQTLVSVGSGFATCWNVATKQRQQSIACTKTTIHSVYISPSDNMRAIGEVENRLNVWDIETSNTFAILTQHQKKITSVAFDFVGQQWVSADIEGKLYVSDDKDKQIALFGHTDSIVSLAFAPDGKRLVSASRDNTVRVWDITNNEEIASLHLTPLLDGKLLDANLYKGDYREIQRLHKLFAKGSSGPRMEHIIRTIAFSPCCNVIAGGLYREIRLWDATTYEVRMVILPPIGCYYPFALAFSPCGQYLASGSWWQNTEKVSIRLWVVATGENIATFWGHSTDVQDLVFSPDGTLLASGSYDGTILLWDMKPYL